MKPYKFEPYLKTTIWGGYQIAPFKGIFNAQPNVGESWEISGVPGHESVAVSRGLIDDVDEGLTLVELIDYCMNTPEDGLTTAASVETIKKLIIKNRGNRLQTKNEDQ